VTQGFTHITNAFAFESRLSFDELCERANRGTPWTWRGSESDTYGDSLWASVDEHASLRISGTRPRWILEISVLPGAPPGRREELHDYFFTRWLPWLGVKGVTPTDPTR
jgi:hypothetical protein